MKSGNKKARRKVITIGRVIRYGSDSFLRNAWLSVAATAVMTITLLIIFTTVIAQNVLSDTLGELREKVDMSIYLKPDVTDEIGDKLVSSVEKLKSVKSASFISSAQARADFIENNKTNKAVLEAIKEATNKTPATIRVVMNDINEITELQNFVKNDATIKKYINEDFKPSFAGERRNTIKSIGRAVGFAQKIGIVAGLIFLIISSLIIFNTIRMAIFNRKEEIQMMKLIGANQSFIRGPFIIESMIYGFIAALIASGVGVWALYGASKTLKSYQISIDPTIHFVNEFAVLVVIGMVVIGAIIGIISSLFATKRYLKV